MATDLRTTVVPQVEANLPFPRCIAVDFDGTLFVTDFPHIYEPKWDVINRAKAEQAAGTVLILGPAGTGSLSTRLSAPARRLG